MSQLVGPAGLIWFCVTLIQTCEAELSKTVGELKDCLLWASRTNSSLCARSPIKMI